MDRPDTIIRLTDVSMIYDRKTALTDINLSINRGDFLAITGPNGGGKTTLLRIILKLLNPTHGKVDYFSNGEPSKQLSIGYLPQKNMIDSRFPITVRDVVALGLYGSMIDNDTRRTAISDALLTVGMSEKSSECIGDLSGGQLQRALLARAIISRPDVLVLDEPLSYIDKSFEHQMYDIISDIARKTTVILVSHEISTIASMANRHVIVDRTLHFCHSANHFIHYDCCDS